MTLVPLVTDPPTSATTTAAVPAASAGEVQVTEVAETTTTEVHAVPPIVMVGGLAELKLVPVMVSVLPPDVGNKVGDTDPTVGVAM